MTKYRSVKANLSSAGIDCLSAVSRCWMFGATLWSRIVKESLSIHKKFWYAAGSVLRISRTWPWYAPYSLRFAIHSHCHSHCHIFLFWPLWLSSCFSCTIDVSKWKLAITISSSDLLEAIFVWFVYATKLQRATGQLQCMQPYRATLLHTRATKLREKISGVTSVIVWLNILADGDTATGYWVSIWVLCG